MHKFGLYNTIRGFRLFWIYIDQKIQINYLRNKKPSVKIFQLTDNQSKNYFAHTPLNDGIVLEVSNF